MIRLVGLPAIGQQDCPINREDARIGARAQAGMHACGMPIFALVAAMAAFLKRTV
jgi:hypothetical protein